MPSRTTGTVPTSTYRLQLGPELGFAKVEALAPYLEELGVGHVYLSPILQARAGSTHGYDTVDHGQLDTKLGTLADFRSMATALHQRGIGILLDFVPNHMGVGGADNALWLDVLEAGAGSRYADWFDIDWTPPDPELGHRLLVPVLGVSRYEAIRTGAVSLAVDAAAGSLSAWAHNAHKLPLRAASYAVVLPKDVPELAALAGGFVKAEAEPASLSEAKRALSALLVARPDIVRRIEAETDRINRDPVRLASALAAQHWLLAHFVEADDRINYRRFFNIADLAGIRVERDDVFTHIHRLVFDLIGEGLVDGLRIDHIDGLAYPGAYCHALRERAPRPIYIVVEKILAAHEHLRPAWHVDGTTGYEFISQLTPLLVDPAAEAALTDTYRAFVGRSEPFTEIERQASHRVMDNELAAERESLSHLLCRLARATPATAELTRAALARALQAIIAELPVYRTYIDEPADGPGRRAIRLARLRAQRHNPALAPAALEFVAGLLAGEDADPAGNSSPSAAHDLIRRVQQWSGPVMAKGLEDTALYRYARLVALNEVGQRPDRFSSTPSRFHDASRSRLRHAPGSMLATSTHDTKRGEDTRARIAAITGAPERWRQLVEDLACAIPRPTPIDPEDEYLLYQTLLGAWPVELSPTDVQGVASLQERVRRTMQKSAREARRHTDWRFPNLRYETALDDAIVSLFSSHAALQALADANDLFGPWGAHLGLVQAALKLTVPGVPDIYAGAEGWEQSMVDPDNRRPLDIPAMQARLGETRVVPDWSTWWADWRDARVKIALTSRLLSLRRAAPRLFAQGSYEPLAAGEDTVAFLRRLERQTLVVCARLRPWHRQRPISLTVPEGGDVWFDPLGSAEMSARHGSLDIAPDAPLFIAWSR